MTALTSLRIDTAIKPISYLYLLFSIAIASILIVLAALASLALWQYILILIISAVVIGYLALSRPILLHLSQPPLDKSLYQDWQLLIRTSRGDALWQAKLNTVSQSRWVICFDFNIIEPYQRRFSVAIFRDQVSPEQWRELTILANMIASKIV
ncbi:hypothetical protein Psyc_1735 [Psychrobacter arcticus 273-4]|uniref:YcxB-like protein domain-containing protein n=1 Tax=Psychrobacter arcticus (strain DSM 17307 / VKM B-2377 / 273-4) TaxID=259536 RepID=Q4FQX5_PSYA2|nr:hypothetical protein [Psychrobacter arcticus]AAZ19583.1 hypothetical protein Psyc_1735 [Psychrobacter arcticus 273-4]